MGKGMSHVKSWGRDMFQYLGISSEVHVVKIKEVSEQEGKIVEKGPDNMGSYRLFWEFNLYF